MSKENVRVKMDASKTPFFDYFLLMMIATVFLFHFILFYFEKPLPKFGIIAAIEDHGILKVINENTTVNHEKFLKLIVSTA